MKKMTRFLPLLALSLGGISPAFAQAQGNAMNMPGMDMGKPAAPTTAPATGNAVKPAAGMGDMAGMASSIDLNDPMSQEASGTAWLPASSPMYGKMYMLDGNMLMLHGAAMPRYTDVGSKRGDSRFDLPNWFMGMFSHPLDDKSQLGLRGMFSLDPITEGGYGYPLLYQTGETWHSQPLHDRQHPHDLVDELAATYSHLLGGGKSIYFYAAYPGEPALGPPTYMHRLLAYDLADAPIGHHWQDATHITFGVATVGFNMNSKLKIEASDFTGREPDENRYSFDKPRFDSYSTRLSYNPDDNNALQVSYGLVRNPEGDGADVHRTTASWLYNKPLGEDSNFTTALVFGQNDLTGEGITRSYLAEADYQRGRNTFFTRYEDIDKSGRELVLPEANLQGEKFNLNAITVGYVRDLTHGSGIDTGLGFAVTEDTHPAALNADYGSGGSQTFQIYLRFRPSRMKGMAGNSMGSMNGMKMDGGSAAMPGMTPTPAQTPPMSEAPSPAQAPAPPAAPTPAAPTMPAPPTTAPAAPVTIASVTAAMQPDPPKARQKNTLTLTVTGSDGKPLAGASVAASVAMTSMDMGTGHPAFKDMGAGQYAGSVKFGMPGSWRVSVTVTPAGGGTPVTRTFDYNAQK